MPSSYTASFPADILPDSAFLAYGATGSAVLLGATLGGVDFDPQKKYRNPDFDGKRSDIYLLDRIESHMAKVTCKLLQYGASTISFVEPGMTSASGGTGVSVVYTPQPGSLFLTSGAYIANLRVIWERTSGAFFQIRMPRALVETYKLVSKDKAETTVECSFTSRLDLTGANTTDTAPYIAEQLTITTLAGL